MVKDTFTRSTISIMFSNFNMYIKLQHNKQLYYNNCKRYIDKRNLRLKNLNSCLESMLFMNFVEHHQVSR